MFSWLKWFFSGNLLSPRSGWRYSHTSNSWTSEIVIVPVKQSGLSGGGGACKSAWVFERGVSRGIRGPSCSLSPSFLFPIPRTSSMISTTSPQFFLSPSLFPSVKRSGNYDTHCLWEALEIMQKLVFICRRVRDREKERQGRHRGRQADRDA